MENKFQLIHQEMQTHKQEFLAILDLFQDQHQIQTLDQKLLQINLKHEGWSFRNSKCTEHFEFIESI